MKEKKYAFIDDEGVIHEINLKNPKYHVINHKGWREVEVIECDALVSGAFQLHESKEALLKVIHSQRSYCI